MPEALEFAFLHGGAQGGWVWAETVDALRGQSREQPVRTLVFDVPGCGAKRDRNVEALAFEDIVAELAGELTDAGMANAVLVGHSQAGTLMPALAAQGGGRVRHLVYVACSMPLPGQTVIEMMGEELHGSREDQVGWPVDPRVTSPHERARVMLCNDMDAAETTAFMARLGGDAWPPCSYTWRAWPDAGTGMRGPPATYVICLQDNILPVPWQTRFAQRLGAARLVRIDAGHQVMNTRPQALAEILLHEARSSAQH